MSQNCIAQIQDFELDIIATDETCVGNGTLAFSIDNPTPNASFLYTVYLLPNEATPVSSSAEPFVGSLVAGTYKVVALETLGTESLSVEGQVTIQNAIEPLTYSISSVARNCNVGGEIIITAITGTAVAYEIISGPQPMPLQESNSFMGMPEGVYNIRVFDECGQGVVTTYTVELNPAAPVVSQPIFNNTQEGNCETVSISNTISYPEGTALTYPITIQYTIYPPGGGTPEIDTQYFNEGLPGFIEFSHTFPVVPGDGYTYDILVTNGCGLSYGTQGNAVNPTPIVGLQAVPIPCGHYYLSITSSQYMPPYSMQFTQVPEGFNPETLNTAYPGPFTESTVNFGDDNTAIPEGTYQVTITDACGRTASGNIDVNEIVPEPTAEGQNNGCFDNLGRITVSVPERQIVNASIIEAPATYNQPLPQNVASFINDSGVLVVPNLPLGDYTLKVVDECGREHIVEVTVPEFTPRSFAATRYSDCTAGSGAVRVMSPNGFLVETTLISAPAAYGGNLPEVVTDNIDVDGRLYMDGLPAGIYVFKCKDTCGIEETVSINITSYQADTGDVYIYEPLCNSWNITVDDDASVDGASYWLQKENPGQPGQWVHPETGVSYTEGSLPTNETSYELTNGITTYNLQFFGNFRVVKAVQTVGQGVKNKLCLTAWETFSYQYGVEIQGVYNVACFGNADDVLVQASGLAPLTYRIVEKDGQPFIVENGQNNIFSGLEPGVYVFEVQNGCQQTGTATQNVNLLPNLVEATPPGDMLQCVEPGDSQFLEFNLLDTKAQILGGQSPDVYTVTYYTSVTDAQNNVNAIADPEHYTNIASPQVIYARVQHNFIDVCHEVVDFIIQVSESPVVEMEDFAVLCDNQGSVQLTATLGYDAYAWSTGATTPTITVTEPGDYSVRIIKDYGIGTCFTEQSITVLPSSGVEDFDIEIVDWTDNDNSISINATGIGAYEFSIDGVNYQTDPVFTGLPIGVYTVHIRDGYGCGEVTDEVALLNYPRYFTPNGDGVNDTWHIPFSWFEPNMMLYIYDRYGKLITSFNGQSSGWDGTLNNQNLPSTDYWFVAQRQDGRIFKGHFSMLR